MEFLTTNFELSYLFYISFLVLFGWTWVLLHKTGGIPVSLSETRYLVNHRKVGHLLWYLMCSLTAIPLLIVWLYHLNANDMSGQLLAYLTALGLVGVGIAGDFKDAKYKFIIHCSLALVSAAGCVIWILMYSPISYIIVPLAIFFIMCGLYCGGRTRENLKGKPERNAIVFFAEMICFISLYIVLYYFFNF